MNWPSVSIAFPCWHRGALLRNTLESIRKQNYPGELELIVVEEDDDGLTENLATEFGARYIRNPRLEAFPVFQSITKLWNMCLHATTNEIVILQCAEVLHKNDAIIPLVVRVLGGHKILATPLIEDLNQDGTFAGWYNHPTEGSRPGWVSGAGPHCFRREEMLEVGGYEELFYGYGGEDNYLFFLLKKNGWSVEYVESALCGHQWHERTKYEPTTGYANRSLINILTMEVDRGTRAPVANKEPLDLRESPNVSELNNVLLRTNYFPMSDTFSKWRAEWLQIGTETHPDNLFVVQRIVANEGLGKVSEIGEALTECAWAILRETEARFVAALAYGNWKTRASFCADIHATWAALSLDKAKQLMEK
jgi:cellulose synthase/poly-beta-1,6-N-acetylglucosamine synthase-like glycosyltransferase